MATTTMNETDFFVTPPPVEAETFEPPTIPAIVISDPHGVAAEQYRVLRYRMECLQRAGHKAIAFTSAQSGEGRTTTVVNLALTLARGGQNRVALVDLDLRRPGVADMLGLHARSGLCDVVARRVRLDEALWQLGREELYVLPAGRVPEDHTSVLYDPNLAELLTGLKARFDFVLVDTPPILPLADVATLCQSLDGAVMVVRAGTTSRELVESATSALYDVPIHGMILNDVDPSATLTLQIQDRLPAKSTYRRALPSHH